MKLTVLYYSLFCCWLICPLQSTAAPKTEEQKSTTLYAAGLRRSSYGLKKKNTDHLWWAERAKQFSKAVSGENVFTPVIIEIVSVYLTDGTCQMEFKKPDDFSGNTANISFNPRSALDHEKALTIYDQEEVKAILQVEPGNADVFTCLDLANAAFGHHPCIIGYGVDTEWYFTKESENSTGRPIEDINAERWINKVTSFNPEYTLFLKHWAPSHMPPAFRHDHLWFLSDSQDFSNLDQMMQDFQKWGKTYSDSTVGFQFGYPKDHRWWREIERPLESISKTILKGIPNTRFLLWVDFTADKISFAANSVDVQPLKNIDDNKE